jgi:hypothetical protein
MIAAVYEQVITPGAGIAAVLGFVLGTSVRTTHSAVHLGRKRLS